MSDYRYHNGKRWIGGNAALLHKIKEDGGLNEHYAKIVNKALPAIFDAIISEENRKDLKKLFKIAK